MPCPSCHDTVSVMSLVSRYSQRYVPRVTIQPALCHSCHDTVSAMSLGSRYSQRYVPRVTLRSTLCLSDHYAMLLICDTVSTMPEGRDAVNTMSRDHDKVSAISVFQVALETAQRQNGEFDSCLIYRSLTFPSFHEGATFNTNTVRPSHLKFGRNRIVLASHSSFK